MALLHFFPTDDWGVLWGGEGRAQGFAVIYSLRLFSPERPCLRLYPVWGESTRQNALLNLPKNTFRKYLQPGSQISKPSADSCLMQDTCDEPHAWAPMTGCGGSEPRDKQGCPLLTSPNVLLPRPCRVPEEDARRRGKVSSRSPGPRTHKS